MREGRCHAFDLAPERCRAGAHGLASCEPPDPLQRQSPAHGSGSARSSSRCSPRHPGTGMPAVSARRDVTASQRTVSISSSRWGNLAMGSWPSPRAAGEARPAAGWGSHHRSPGKLHQVRARNTPGASVSPRRARGWRCPGPACAIRRRCSTVNRAIAGATCGTR